MIITWWSKLGGGSWKRFKKVARLLPESSLLISKRMEVMVTTWSHGHMVTPTFLSWTTSYASPFTTSFEVHCNQILYMFQDHFWYFSETSTFYITSYPEMKVKANRSWRKASLLTITSLSSTSQSYHYHHYLIFVIVFKLKVLLETISPLVPPSPPLTAINVKMVTECNCSTPTLLQTHLKHVTPM